MDKLLIGKTIKIPCMRPGPCGYEDEVVMLSQPTLEKMSKTAHGIPVVIDHRMDDEIKADESLIVGRVADLHWDDARGEWDAHFVVDSQEAIDKLKAGWGVSTAYRITAVGPAGSFNAIPYDREVADGQYIHLAIVETPRYEIATGAVFYNSMSGVKKSLKSSEQGDTIINSSNQDDKSGGSKMAFRLWRSKREEIRLNGNDGNEELVIEIEGKGEKRLNEMLEEMKNYEDDKIRKQEAEEAEKAKKPAPLGDDAVVEYNGEKMTVGALKNKYNEMLQELEAAKKNAEEAAKDEPKANEEKSDEPKANEGEEPKANEDEPKANEDEKKPEAEEKTNSVDSSVSKNFDELHNAHVMGGMVSGDETMSLRECLELARQMYGTK